jgi:acyl-homoserine-lactone acylase
MSRIASILLCLFLVQACSDNDNDNNNPVEPEPPAPEPEVTFQADIVWTEYGIPHVTADDWDGLGYGLAYAYARDNYCIAMSEVVRAAGDSARYLEDGDLNEDLVFKLYSSDEAVARMLGTWSDRVVQLNEGYAAGMNRYLRETGVDNLAEGEEGCRGAEWVREIDVNDMVRVVHKRILRASGQALADLIVLAEPPTQTAARFPAAVGLPDAAAQRLAALDPATANERMGIPQPETFGSNAYSVGSDASQVNSGVLYGNPHFPWQGADRFYMSHMTIPGTYDVMGAGLHALPGILIGFNKDVAWSHTVSTARRFTFHELTLNPDNPLEYIVDGEIKAFEPATVSAGNRTEDGSIETVEHTFYLSEYGPVVDASPLEPALGGWPTIFGTLFAYQDANLENMRSIEYWLNVGQSTSIDEYKEASRLIGNPWANSIAADRFGNAFYGDITVAPHVTQQKIDTCVRGVVGQLALDTFGLIVLDGSDSSCDWGNDEDAPQEGIFGFDSLPSLDSGEYTANANDSYWLSNPRHLLEGYSRIMGQEEIEQSIRTRLTFVQAEERINGLDDLGEPGFSNENVRAILSSARNLAAELVNDDLVALCEGVDWSAYSASPADVAQACGILEAWDTRHTVTSVGGHIFFEFWRIARNLDSLWAVPFDPAFPVTTPNTLNTGDGDLVEAVRQALADGVQVLLDNSIALDAPWGEVQFDERNGERIAIPGGSGAMLFSVITSDLVNGEGYSNIQHGNSYIQAVSWDETDCPDANAILTYSQSSDPASAHYADATRLYSESGWIDMPFCEGERDAQEINRESIEE